MASKPLHPAAIHFPIAFLMLGFGLDLTTAAWARLPGSLIEALPPKLDLHRASYWLLTLGLFSAVPAVLTGGVEAIKLIGKQGLYEADGRTLRTKVKAVFAHAILADISLAITGYMWWTRRAAVNASWAEKLGGVPTEAAYAPAAWMAPVEIAVFLLFGYSLNIGGALVYNYGVGFQSVNSAKKTQ